MKTAHAAIGISALALALAGCADPPPAQHPPATSAAATSTGGYKACLLTGEEDPTVGSPAAQAIAGLARAANELGIQTERGLASETDEQAGAIQGLIDAHCNLVVGLGRNVSDAFVAAAKANPGIQFAVMDANPTELPPNLRPVLFRTHESGFLAGYLAAAHSKTGKVGAFGARAEPGVIIYLDGFVQGVSHYNEAKQASVEAIGWSIADQRGTFVHSDKDPFNDPEAGRAATKQLTDQGADVVLAVAAESGVGALEVAAESAGTRIIWTGEDGCAVHEDHCGQILTSVVKDHQAALLELIKSESADRNVSGVFAASLRNGGTHLTGGEDEPEIGQLAQGIVEGRIKVTSAQAIG